MVFASGRIAAGTQLLQRADHAQDRVFWFRVVSLQQRNCTSAQPLWQVYNNPKKQRVEPIGLAIAVTKSQQVPGGGQLTLS